MTHEYAIIACMSKLKLESSVSASEAIRRHAYEKYVLQARRRSKKTIAINVGEVHRALGLNNRVPLVSAALNSKKFLSEHNLRLVGKTGPPSGQSTTVTYTYEFVDEAEDKKELDREDAWNRLRGALKDVYAEYGGGEAYLRAVRASLRDTDAEK
jgi:hypothetical protein